MTYTACFFGRKVGAIGVCYSIKATVEGRNEEEAQLALYDRFEHIQQLALTATVTGESMPRTAWDQVV
ncbi:hypothetical protein LCGC14_1262800 [marine sediment metagenome]|uniref:Uncharacterized protein n=1 Tax=marine sediment metagenome TaxID=412755 RepID=A0A0F9P3J3_9ZZZZ